MRLATARRTAAFTFVENVVAIAVIVMGFAALYAMNSQCMYFSNSARKTFSGFQALQDRMEQFRNLSYAQVTDPTYICNNVLNTPGFNSGALMSLTETITINSFPTPVSPPIKVTRTNGTASVVSTNAALATGALLKIDISMNWTHALNKRTRSAAVCTIWGQTAE